MEEKGTTIDSHQKLRHAWSHWEHMAASCVACRSLYMYPYRKYCMKLNLHVMWMMHKLRGSFIRFEVLFLFHILSLLLFFSSWISHIYFLDSLVVVVCWFLWYFYGDDKSWNAMDSFCYCMSKLYMFLVRVRLLALCFLLRSFCYI